MLIKSFLVGLSCGIIFTFLLKLPIPAPSTFEGIIGIVGIFLGYYLVKLFI